MITTNTKKTGNTKSTSAKQENKEALGFEDFKKEVLNDYKLAHLSRHMSVLARREVLNGKAKFGIFGDGKEVAQIAMAKQFLEGDWRSGYYRDQTFMLAAGMTTPKKFFALLYGETRTELNPDNGGRSMNNHFGTRLVQKNGDWIDQTKSKNTSSDISPTAGQMPRLTGLALASKLYREQPELKELQKFSNKGNEVAFGTIGDASTSEGLFFETLNAASVLQIPMALSVWDDGYGISVPVELQTVKANISKALKGFEKQRNDKTGILIFEANGWDYAELCQMYEKGISRCRKEHVPVLFHVRELTQPTGHSTSGSHERYKSEKRLKWEKDKDCLVQMRQWIVEKKISDESTLDQIESEARDEATNAKKEAYKEYLKPIEEERDELNKIIRQKSCICNQNSEDQINSIVNNLNNTLTLNRKEILSTARKILRHVCSSCNKQGGLKDQLRKWVAEYNESGHEKYTAYLYDESAKSPLRIESIAPQYSEDAPLVPGREIIRDNFDALFGNDPRLITLGEDTGKLGGVNQTLEGLQKKYGEWRVRDTGIHEATIVGEGIGLALRGLRPIAEIQYFDYLLYTLHTLSDDLATTHYRTKGGQKAPVIVRTRGHRLEGIWHSGSPLSMVVNSIRGIYICVPRDMTRAAGMYNTLLQGEDPALVIEPLNGYRIREKQPSNWGAFQTPLGIPEVIREGTDVTIATYGSCVRIAAEAIDQLSEIGISVELIDVQTLLPFDTEKIILNSLKKTNRIVFFDEDVPGGATAYMMQKVLEEQGGFYYLDHKPMTVTAEDHRPAYGTDGDYFSNPNAEDVYETIYGMMGEAYPDKFPPIY
ncbi:alpha-ketoacid dehydrogenase subunit alpha/beta [Marinilabilia rubra]|uniref:3-methyl-2-oxobutanoate dehydrogenase (2-methylpropanoyl-transferring) n=1 Tax=Marinilabilia rubra TaxID=2162893 RepID=A0A2U2BA32_9BACT|nr:alpha-ketoacid dehydrogenase subunit alpha/beta [Marinilabilia rubra]PWD99941.1 transketolase [Marinilabilia rubra]